MSSNRPNVDFYNGRIHIDYRSICKLCSQSENKCRITPETGVSEAHTISVALKRVSMKSTVPEDKRSVLRQLVSPLSSQLNRTR